jgi:hypothetical protein
VTIHKARNAFLISVLIMGVEDEDDEEESGLQQRKASAAQAVHIDEACEPSVHDL